MKKFLATILLALVPTVVLAAGADEWNKANSLNFLQTTMADGETYTRALYMFVQSGTNTNIFEIENDGTGTAAIVIDNDGTLTKGIVLEGTITTGIDLSGATVTSDIVLENSDTITNPDANTIKVSDKLCLENNECFDNVTDGTVAMTGILDVTSVTLGNDDTITNPDANNIKISDDLKLENDNVISNPSAGVVTLGKAQLHDFRVEVSAASGWTEPYDCTAAEEGTIIYADDNDDTAAGTLCFCANTDGTGYEWEQVHAPGTNCDGAP